MSIKKFYKNFFCILFEFLTFEKKIVIDVIHKLINSEKKILIVIRDDLFK